MRNVRATREDGERYLLHLLLDSECFNEDVEEIRWKHEISLLGRIEKLGKNYLDVNQGFIMQKGKIKKFNQAYYKKIELLCQKYFIPEHLYGLIDGYVGSGNFPRFFKTAFVQTFNGDVEEGHLEVIIPKNINEATIRKAQKYITNDIPEIFMPQKEPERMKISKDKMGSSTILTLPKTIKREELASAIRALKKGKRFRKIERFDSLLELYRLRNTDLGEDTLKNIFGKKQTAYTKGNLKEWINEMTLMIRGLDLIEGRSYQS